MHPDTFKEPTTIVADRTWATAVRQAIEQAGLDCSITSDLGTWADAHQVGVAVVKIASRIDAAAAQAASAMHPQLKCVCVVDATTPEMILSVAAVGLGAIIAQQRPISDLVLAVQAAHLCYAVLPFDLLQQVNDESMLAVRPRLSTDHRWLLDLLVQGYSVDAIADRFLCSRRSIYRRMAELVEILGACTRDQAMYRAGQLQLLSSDVLHS